jgi:hypothetical protein
MFADCIQAATKPGLSHNAAIIGISDHPKANDFASDAAFRTLPDALRFQPHLPDKERFTFPPGGYLVSQNVALGIVSKSGLDPRLQREPPTRDVRDHFDIYGGGISDIEINKSPADSRVGRVANGIKRDLESMHENSWSVRRVELILGETQRTAGYAPQSECEEGNSERADSGKSARVLIERDSLASKKDSDTVKGALLFLGGLFDMFASYAALVRR